MTLTAASHSPVIRNAFLLLIIAFLDISKSNCQHLQTTVIRKYPVSENCTTEHREAIIKCEDDARKLWSVDDSTYVRDNFFIFKASLPN